MTDNEQPQISVQDIANVVNLIDIVSRRGAINGNELAEVGLLRNKLSLFLDANMPKQSEPEAKEVTE